MALFPEHPKRDQNPKLTPLSETTSIPVCFIWESPPPGGLLARVKCQQRNARKSAILSAFPKPRESVSLQKSCYVAGSITSKSFPDFLNLSESCQKKAVFVQRHNTSLHSKFRQTALKLTPKGLEYTQIDTLRELCITDL